MVDSIRKMAKSSLLWVRKGVYFRTGPPGMDTRSDNTPALYHLTARGVARIKIRRASSSPLKGRTAFASFRQSAPYTNRDAGQGPIMSESRVSMRRSPIVNNGRRFSLLGKAFVVCFGCDACCSPPCFYSHFMCEPSWLCADWGSVGEVDAASYRTAFEGQT